MDLPFSLHEFLAVFRDYNQAVWPAQIGLNAAALLCLVLAWRRRRLSSRIIGLLLASLWVWIAVVYFWTFFSTINPLAPQFAVMFGVQVLFFLFVAIRSAQFSFAVRSDARGIAGGVMVLYALVAYPILGMMIGHHYPSAPTFGLPCPTVIFTFGILLWLDRSVPIWLMVIPLIWALIGTAAAIQLGMFEDFGLTIAGGVAAGLMRGRRRSAGLDVAGEQNGLAVNALQR